MSPVWPLAANMSCWLSKDWHTCTFDSIVPLIGEPLFGMLVGVAATVSFYFGTGGRTGTASVFVIVFAGVLINVLPGNMTGVAWTVAFIGLVAAIISVAEKYVLNPAVQ